MDMSGPGWTDPGHPAVALMFAGALAVSAITTPALAATPAGSADVEHMHGM